MVSFKNYFFLLTVFFLTGEILSAEPFSNYSAVTNDDQPAFTVPQSNQVIPQPLFQPRTNRISPLTNSGKGIITTIQTNKTKEADKKKTEKPSTLKINWGFFWLQPDQKFKDAFSANAGDQKDLFYYTPFNSWNDPFYFVLRFDWVLYPYLKTRAGWSVGINMGGSGDDKDSIQVEADTDLGKAHGGKFYAIYNYYNFPMSGYIRIQPVQLWIFQFYQGLGAGFSPGVYTYNELAEESRSAFEAQFDKTSIKTLLFAYIFMGVEFHLIDELETLFFEINYKFSSDPVITNDYLKPVRRSVAFQVSGLQIGCGFRF